MGNKYYVIGKWVKGNTVLAYSLRSGDYADAGEVTKRQLIEMIKSGKIGNCTFHKSGDELIVRGDGIDLRKIPTININKIPELKKAKTIEELQLIIAKRVESLNEN